MGVQYCQAYIEDCISCLKCIENSLFEDQTQTNTVHSLSLDQTRTNIRFVLLVCGEEGLVQI